MSLGLYITNRCDLNCRYCFNWESDKKRKFKSLKFLDICQILAAGREKGHHYLTITGGEPFLHPDIFKVIDNAHNLGYMINILTNGLLIDDSVASKLQGKFRLRIRVSMEGYSKEVHEYFRGRNTFDKALYAIQQLVKNNINVGIGFTVYEENIDEIDNIVRLCIETKCAFVRFSPIVRIQKGKKAKISFDLHENTITKIIESQIKYKDFVEFSVSNDNNIPLPIEALTTKRCEAGCNFFAINPEKIILPCPLIRSDAKIFRKKFTEKKDLDEVNQHMDDLFDDITGKLRGLCASCEFNVSCSGGCLAEKLSFDLTIYDEQPICFKRILENVEKKFHDKEFQLIKKSWTNRIHSSLEQNKDMSKSCFRQAPFWIISFKHGNKI